MCYMLLLRYTWSGTCWIDREVCSDLHKQRVSKTQGALQILPEGVIQEAGPGDLAVLVLVHDELCGLAGRVDDQWIPGKGCIFLCIRISFSPKKLTAFLESLKNSLSITLLDAPWN